MKTTVNINILEDKLKPQNSYTLAENKPVKSCKGFLRLSLLTKSVFFLFFSIIIIKGFSQTVETDSTTLQNDFINVPVQQSIEQIAADAALKSRTNYNKTRLILKQNRVFNQLRNEIQHAENILKQGIDYAEFTKELQLTKNYKDVALKGLLTTDRENVTIRNLTSSSILLTELKNRTDNQLKKIRENNQSITDVQHKIDSLMADESVYVVPQDSASVEVYLQRYQSVYNDFVNINSRLKNALDSIRQLEVLSTSFKFDLDKDHSEITFLQKDKYAKILTARDQIFTGTNPDQSSLLGNFLTSLLKGILLLVFYFYNHFTYIVILFIIFLALLAYLKVLKNKYVRADLYKEFKSPVQIFMHPVATAALISITFYQFFLPLPPFILTGTLWLIAGVALTRIFKKTESKFVFRTWKVFFLLNILAISDNVILVRTVSESWFILILAVTAIIFGGYTIYNRFKLSSKPKIWIIMGMVILEVFSVLFLLIGNYNTGKILMAVGLFTVLVGYLLINAFRLAQNIYAFSEYFKESEDEKNLENLKNRPDKISLLSFSVFLIGWIIIITRNSYGYQRFVEPFGNMFVKTRQIGEFEFSYQGVFVFFLVLILSAFIAKIVSFLADDNIDRKAGSKSSALSSWLLLLRMGIITAGIIIAFRSTGIPVDRLTLIISAIGVGLGFGMQGLVNNLISGVIIAFEKPIEVDDIVEIGPKNGKMKSIGLRSSVVTTWDGADVIIPNGDLLGSHLVNWTMGNNRRRSEIVVGVAYGTDLKKAKSLINEVLVNNKQILKNPAPVIWVINFSESSIDFSVKYWVAHFIYANDIKSDVIIAIDEILRGNGIVIPFPQRDIHVIPDKNQTVDPMKNEENNG
jgi:small-conductance mechanosensitive channel/drug/metabolite transporter superfamily protein YnfA